MQTGYFFSIAIDGGRLMNQVPAKTPGELVDMFVEACEAAVRNGAADPNDSPSWQAFVLEKRPLTKVEDAALIAAFEQKTGKKARWSDD